MRCTEFEELLPLYQDEDLPEAISNAVAKHLMKCSSCSHELSCLVLARKMLVDVVESTSLSERAVNRISNRLQVHFSSHVRKTALPVSARQGTLPFLREEQG